MVLKLKIALLRSVLSNFIFSKCFETTKALMEPLTDHPESFEEVLGHHSPKGPMVSLYGYLRQ